MKCHLVMVIENDLLLRQMLSSELSRRNYITYFAKSGEEALEKLQLISVDLILVEVDLPGMNGWNFIQQLKSNLKTHSIPSLIYSRAIVPRSSPGLTTKHTMKSESLEQLMESIDRICGEDQGMNEHAPEIRRIVLPRLQKKKSAG